MAFDERSASCARSLRFLVAVLALVRPCGGESSQAKAQAAETQRERSLAASWGKALNAATDTPVTRVVNLLKEMQETLGKEMEEDEKLYHELACWCNNGAYEKSEAAEASEAKIAELESTIESLTAKSADLNTRIGELNTEVAADKKALAEATAVREKETQAFHGEELDSIQAIENLKAALVVLSKHEGGSNWMQPALAQLTGQLSGAGASTSAGFSFLSLRSSARKFRSGSRTARRRASDEMDIGSYTAMHEAKFGLTRSLDEFMSSNNFDESHGAEIVATSDSESSTAASAEKAETVSALDSESNSAAAPTLDAPAPVRTEEYDREYEVATEEPEKPPALGPDSISASSSPLAEPAAASGEFLQQDGALAPQPQAVPAGWSSKDEAIVKKALKSASAFVQERQSSGNGYMPSYSAQSGEIVGILKQLKEDMEADLAESQKSETEKAATFEQLRAAKSEEISNGEKMSEEKEDELATTDNSLAEAKEDLGQEKTSLSETQTFLKNLKKTCAEADTNFEARKEARLAEIKAVSETIEILTEDEARDAMAGTYSFVQLSSTSRSSSRESRRAAAKMLRRAAARSGDQELALLANTVELDSFTKVKAAIDELISALTTQQEEEVKKNDWCKTEIQENEMATAKTEDVKSDLEAKVAELEESIKALETRMEEAKAEEQQLKVDLQKAAEERVAANMEYQKTVADQTLTIEVLKKALDKLATYYDKAGSLLQRSGRRLLQSTVRQTPPVPQMEYKASAGAAGVMQMIEKLIYEAKTLVADSKKAEAEAQAAYETTIEDTNGSVAALQEEVVTKTKAVAAATKDKLDAESDIADAVKELEGLAKYNADLHKECDYLLKNFMTRQGARQAEIESLQQAKQILSGASFS